MTTTVTKCARCFPVTCGWSLLFVNVSGIDSKRRNVEPFFIDIKSWEASKSFTRRWNTVLRQVLCRRLRRKWMRQNQTRFIGLVIVTQLSRHWMISFIESRLWSCIWLKVISMSWILTRFTERCIRKRCQSKTAAIEWSTKWLSEKSLEKYVVCSLRTFSQTGSGPPLVLNLS